jgi:hypothetical protein
MYITPSKFELVLIFKCPSCGCTHELNYKQRKLTRGVKCYCDRTLYFQIPEVHIPLNEKVQKKPSKKSVYSEQPAKIVKDTAVPPPLLAYSDTLFDECVLALESLGHKRKEAIISVERNLTDDITTVDEFIQRYYVRPENKAQA